MSILKKIGIGLTHDEVYARAYEKGVLVKNYDEAYRQFAKAADKYRKEGNDILYHRAGANEAIYRYVALDQKAEDAAGQVQAIDEALSHLQHLEEIEEVGSQTDMMPVQRMVDELLGMKAWATVMTTEDNRAKVRHHTEASQAFQRIGEHTLTTRPDMAARDPYHFHLACARYFEGMIVADITPNVAVDKLEEAYANFRLCQIEDDVSRSVHTDLGAMSTKAVCWMCGREVQGRNTHFKHYETHVTPYYQSLADADTRLGIPRLEPAGMPICLTCGSMLEILADQYATLRADEVRQEAAAAIAALRQQMISELNDVWVAIRSLQRVAHTH